MKNASTMNSVKLFPALAALLLAVLAAAAQSNDPAVAARPAVAAAPAAPDLELSERVRAESIAGRRSICGWILRVFPDGVLVECGYTNLLRGTLTKSWLVPGVVVASRAENLVESREPGALCTGTVFLTDLPRGKPHPFDNVIICGYPAGEFAYQSVGTIHRTVRRFSANLDKAVKRNLARQGLRPARHRVS
jgi:hypothetical protein